MRHIALLITATALVVAGCSSSTVYYADGVDLATRDADIEICDAQALFDYPIQNQARYTSPVFHPPEQICDGEGCVTRPAFVEPGERFIVDLNDESRSIAARSCMGSRGYARISLPTCEIGVEPDVSTVMPPLSSGTCIAQSTGSPGVILNPTDF